MVGHVVQFSRPGTTMFSSAFPRVVTSLFSTLIFTVSSNLWADDLFLAAGGEFPGRLRLSEGDGSPNVVFSRQDRPNPAYPNAQMKLARVAVAVDRSVYYCSGLDGSIMHLLDGQHEIQVLEIEVQIRDLACTDEPHTIYYSVVPTPQDGESLQDGVVYRRDFQSGSPEVVARIPQAEVGGNWWGTFCILDSEIILLTNESPNRVFKWSGGAITHEFGNNTLSLSGITISNDKKFLVSARTGHVHETTDFQVFRTVLMTSLPLTDVSIIATETGGRP